MRPGYNENPVNPVPAVVWMLALPIIASETYFALGRLGFVAGGTGMGAAARQLMVERTAFAPDFIIRAWDRHSVGGAQLWRLITYPFVHYSLTHALFVTVFLLALGNMVARAIRPWAVAALFAASAVGAGLVYALVAGLLPQLTFEPLVGGYPAVYGLLGAFTFLLWTRLGQEHANQLRAFSLIGFMLGFQQIFGLLLGGSGKSWIAEVAGFAIGFLLSFVLVPGGPSRLRRAIRHR